MHDGLGGKWGRSGIKIVIGGRIRRLATISTTWGVMYEIDGMGGGWGRRGCQVAENMVGMRGINVAS